VTVQDIIEFQSGAKMYGDIICKGIIIQQGVFFEGNCSMSGKDKERPKEIKEDKGQAK
jgi:cytoskeletal protein CcmA (bactofilin family)